MTALEPLMTQDDAAKLLGVSPGTLRNWRWRNKGPSWIRLGEAIRYSPQALREYVEVRTRRPSLVREVA